MKILHVEAGKNLYGGALQVYYLMRGLHERGVQNVLVCPPKSAIGKAAQDIAEVVECSMNGDIDLMFYFRLKKLVKLHMPDVLHVHSRRGADHFGAMVAKATGVKSVLTRRVDNTEAKWSAQWKAQRFTEMVAISEGIRQVQISLGVDPQKIRTIHSAVDTQKFSVDRTRRQPLLTRFNLPEQSFVIGVVAQLIERKGHEFLFNVLPDIVSQYPQVRVLVLGKGPHESHLKTAVADAQLDNIVTFAGFQTDIENIMPGLDLVVHPALKEGLGVALLQASACGVPVVACAAGGIPEIVQHQINGEVVPPGDASALQAAIEKVLGDPELYLAYAKNGPEVVKAQFSIEAMVQGNYALYQQM